LVLDPLAVTTSVNDNPVAATVNAVVVDLW
jgi:hypothetical protein